MEHLDIVPRYLREPGVEIGAFRTPIPGIKPTYIDLFAHYAGAPTIVDYYGDACSLPYFDSSLNYVATSHVIEHVANPFAAFVEWHRVLAHGGIIYMVVPDRAKTFDHPRPLTSIDHMLEDFRKGTTQSDGTHIDDFVYGMDWLKFLPDTPVDQVQHERDTLAGKYRGAVAAGLPINIHFHVFDSATVLAMIQAGNRERLWPGRIDVLEVQETFPDSTPIGFLVVAKVQKPLWHRLTARFRPKGLRPDAKKLEPSNTY